MNDIVPFSFEDHSVRVLTRDGEPWFVLADVCRALEVGNPSQAATRLDGDERDTLILNDPRGAPHETGVINESGLYSLILTSRKEAAKRFKKWVTSEVLPAIRKTGGYMVARPEETQEELALRAIKVLQATVDRQQAELDHAAPKAQAFDLIAATEGSLTVMEAAKALQLPKSISPLYA